MKAFARVPDNGGTLLRMGEDASRRSRWEISYDLLKATLEEEAAHDGKAKKTRIMQAAHLDWRNFQRYFDYLIEYRFIARSEGEDYYYLTDKGRKLKAQLEELQALLAQSKSSEHATTRGQL